MRPESENSSDGKFRPYENVGGRLSNCHMAKRRIAQRSDVVRKCCYRHSLCQVAAID